MAEFDSGHAACPGCGALVPNSDGPTHRYIGASPGCWALHGEVLARRYADARFGDAGLLLTNSYPVQHPGTPSPQSIQSVAVHLIGLYAVLERGIGDDRLIPVLTGAADGSALFRWLEPPTYQYPVTIVDLLATTDPVAAGAVSRAMAEGTWQAWAVWQPQIRQWTAELHLI